MWGGGSMRPRGSVQVAYGRDGRGVESGRVTLARSGAWGHLSERDARLTVLRGEGELRAHGASRRITGGDSWSCPARTMSVVTTGEHELELIVRAASVEADGGGERETPDAGLAIEPRPVRRARLYLERCFTRQPTLDELAREAGVSKYHLARLFRAFHGLPPHAYLTYVRVAAARTMLAGGARGTAIAAQTGFADQSHFSRSFRRVMGLSPLEYARASRGAGAEGPWPITEPSCRAEG